MSNICQNKKAFHDYHVLEQYEAGLVLEGWEVKAIRARKVSINEAYVRVVKGEIKLIGCHITPEESSTNGFVQRDQTRTRALLLHAREISKMIGRVERDGYTMIPLDLHYSRGRIKINIALAKGKKDHDKRHDMKERDADAQARQAMKTRRRTE